MFIHFWERERQNEPGRSRERGRHRIQSSLQVLGCQHRVRPGARTYQWWYHDLSQSRTLNWLSQPPRRPEIKSYMEIKYISKKNMSINSDDEAGLFGENGWDLEMLHVRWSVGTWERTIVESVFKSYVRARLPGIICWEWFFYVKQ